MKIVTKGAVKYSNACGCSGIDGSSSSDDIRSFQKFALSKGARNTTGKKAGEPISIDGVWGANTAFAWGLYGKQWEAAQTKASPSPAPTPATPKMGTMDESTAEWVKTHPEKPATKFLDKIKALPLPAKIGIGVGATVLIGFIVWKLIPKK